MATSNTAIKITSLPNIGNNIAPTTLIPVVNMAGVPTTQKANLQIAGNLILAGAGTANFVPAALANLAYTVVNSNQSNITRVGTLNINTLKVSGGTNGQYIQTDGAGNLSWVTGGGSGNGVVGGSTGQIQFNNAGSFGGSANLVWDNANARLGAANIATNSVTVYGNLVAVNITASANIRPNAIYTDHYYYANGYVFGGGGGNGTPGGDTTQVQFNDSGAFGGNTGFTFNKTSGLFSSPFVAGNGNGLSNIQGANVSGTVGSATYAGTANAVAGANVSGAVSFAGTANSVAVANVVGIGNIATVALNGNGNQVLLGNGTWGNASGGNVSLISNGNSNVTIPNGNGNVYINSTAGKQWDFDTTGNLTLPGDIVGQANANFVIYANASAYQFTFADDGTFYAPDNVVLSGSSIAIGPGANTLTGISNAVLIASSNSTAYIQAAITNVSDIGSADWAAYGHRGDDNGGWIDMGFNSSGYSGTDYTITGPGDGSILVESYYDGQSPGGRGGNLILATGGQGTVRDMIFATGGFLIANEFMRISDANNALEFYDGGNITGANVISANVFAIEGGTTLNQVEGPNTVGFYNSEANTQFLFELGSSKVWGFNGNTGGTIFPQLSVQRGDNPSGTITGQTLLFDSSSQEAIITTPDGNDVDGINSQRLVINPGAGAPASSGEGGDIYLWAGRGGSASGSGGDIKIRGGQGGYAIDGGSGGDGGYIRMEAGDAAGIGGTPGYIEITGGVAGYGTPGIAGGDVTITGGIGQNGNGGATYINGGYGGPGYHGGNVQINGGGTSSGSSSEGNVNIQTGGNTWTFDPSGNLTLPEGGIIHETGIPFGGLTGNTIALKPAGGTNADQQLLVYPTAGQDFNHLHLTSGNLLNTELFLGNDDFYVKLANTGNIVINTNDSVGNTAQWTFGTNGATTNPVILFANLPLATTPGLRAFISDGNLAPIGNFGVEVSGGGGNYVPVFSDGANWCIG